MDALPQVEESERDTDRDEVDRYTTTTAAAGPSITGIQDQPNEEEEETKHTDYERNESEYINPYTPTHNTYTIDDDNASDAVADPSEAPPDSPPEPEYKTRNETFAHSIALPDVGRDSLIGDASQRNQQHFRAIIQVNLIIIPP